MAAIMATTTGIVQVRSISGTLNVGGIVTSLSGAVIYMSAADTYLRAGTGATVHLGVFGTADFWKIGNSGHFLAETDNTYDIGASGATRPRTIYVGTDAIIGGTLNVGNATGFKMSGNSTDGKAFLYNNAKTDFTLLGFGGTTSSFPALKRNAAAIDCRLADDSGYANFSAATGVFTGGFSALAGITLAGTVGVPAIVAYGNTVAATNTGTASICTVTPTVDTTYVVSANVLVTTSTTHSFSIDCTYTDEASGARTMVLPMAQLAGSFITSGLITNVTGVGPYESAAMTIRVKANTAVTLRTSSGGTFTTVVYNARGAIRQIS